MEPLGLYIHLPERQYIPKRTKRLLIASSSPVLPPPPRPVMSETGGGLKQTYV